MTIAIGSIGAVARGTGVTLACPAPSVINTGDALLVFTWEFIGSQTVATPSGYTALDHNTNAHQVRCFGTIALGGGSDVLPSFTWGAGSIARTFAVTFTGVDSGLTADFTPNDRTANNTIDIIGPAATSTPLSNGSLILLCGTKNKTATSNGSVFTAPAAFTNGILFQDVVNGASTAFACSYWIQGAATAIAANTGMSGSIADGTNQSMQGSLISLLAAVQVIAPPTSGGIFVCP